MKNTIIKIKGARQHNLKNINISIPKNKLVVFTGVSGSGKSSLAHDTIYAEGQRRYVESLSTYARQFLGIMEKPDVDLIEGLSPAISIDQKTTSRNPRSTVGTITEIYDYLRLLYARIGHPHCPICGNEIKNQTLDEIVQKQFNLLENISKNKKSVRILILSPQVIDKKGEFSSLFSNLKAKGFTQVRVDKVIKNLSEKFYLIKTNKHTIEAVIDKVSLNSKDLKDKVYKDNLINRLSDSTEQALKLSDGLVVLSEIKDKSFEMPEKPKDFEDHLFSEKFACPIDNVQIPEIEPRSFSFNSPHGACPTCNGVGKILKVNPESILSEEISITEGAILPYSNMFEHDTWYSRLILTVCDEHGIDAKTSTKNLSKETKDMLLYGTGEREYKVHGTNRFGRETHIWEYFRGIVKELERRHKNSKSDWVRTEIEKYMIEKVCEECNGTRLKKEALGVTINKLPISEVVAKDIKNTIVWIKNIKDKNLLSDKEKQISKLILNEVEQRLKFLESVGLEYLTLERSASTLSGGEAQRIRLASQIGSGLTGVLYILDEPTIGLHQKDNLKLINTLKSLRDTGNTVIVVEHDEEMIRNSDHVIDFGPGAGKGGGKVVIQGSPKAIIRSKKSLTGQYLSGKRKVNVTKLSLQTQNTMKENNSTFIKPKLHFMQGNISNNHITLNGCSQYNLKNISVEFPLGKFVAITGVSGSGKSTLLVETLYPILLKKSNPFTKQVPGKHKNADGIHNIDKVVLIDQSPIGRTPRSNPATYTKLFDPIREVFSSTRDAKSAGYKKGRFSFNVKGGRCDACQGQGQIKIEMQFMSDIWITCDVCHGKRYNSPTLDIEYKGKNIAEILSMTVDEAYEFFHIQTNITNKLDTLRSVGLGYIELGQPATTLSGGEAQRVKLATELAKKATGNTVYILDEPTTGLHFYDVQKLLNVLRMLVDKGNSVFIIEHNLDVIRNTDWIIDLGPEGGNKGGEIIASGTPSQLKKVKNSYTGKYLSKTN